MNPQPGPSEVLILGGGLAGGAAAVALARAGRRVVVVEREREPRPKVCGEFLSAEALHLLHFLGVDPAALGAVPIHAVRFCAGGSVIRADLPFAAASLTRTRLDPSLLAAAEAAGVHVLRGLAVENLAQIQGQWQARLSDGQLLCAPDAILASGKHDLRGHPRPAGRQGNLVAMKMYWRLAPSEAAALAGHVELVLYPGGYTGLEPVEDGIANLCGLVRRDTLARLGGGWPALLAHTRAASPHLRTRLAGAEPLLAKPLAIASIPYGFVRSGPVGDRLFAVGDQAAVIPSFTGDGMSIALFSGLRAAAALLGGTTSRDFQHQLGRDLHGQVARATAISRALVHGPSRLALTAAVRLWPGWLRTVARATRLPAPALAAVLAE